MFASKPASATLEFAELDQAFDRGALAALFDRNPDTVSRWSRERRVPHTAEAVVDRFWWVMHVACSQRQWPVERAKFFLLTIEPGIGRRPAELVRESHEQAESVVQLIIHDSMPGLDRAALLLWSVKTPKARPESPFAELMADVPAPDRVLTRAYRTPSLVGRARPIGGTQEDLDPLRVRYTASVTHAIPLEPAGAGSSHP